MTDRKVHSLFPRHRLTECGLDSWTQPVIGTQHSDLVTCKTCLKLLGYSTKWV